MHMSVILIIAMLAIDQACHMASIRQSSICSKISTCQLLLTKTILLFFGTNSDQLATLERLARSLSFAWLQPSQRYTGYKESQYMFAKILAAIFLASLPSSVVTLHQCILYICSLPNCPYSHQSLPWHGGIHVVSWQGRQLDGYLNVIYSAKPEKCRQDFRKHLLLTHNSAF